MSARYIRNRLPNHGSVRRGIASRRDRPAGFTLVELLVVVAIIAVLMGILLPALSNARKQARALQCATNLRSQGQGAHLYATEWNDHLVRGLAPTLRIETITYAVAILPGLGYDGKIAGLWKYARDHTEVIRIIRSFPQFQCPTHPIPEQSLDYVSSPMPIPYTRRNERNDQDGGAAGEEFQGVMNADYHGFTRTANLARFGASRLVFATEAHKSLPTESAPTGDDGIRYHHVFFTNQLPFGAAPRIANDQRHPGGLNCMFFDGHVQKVPPNVLDPGWPNERYIRLRWFTVQRPAD